MCRLELALAEEQCLAIGEPDGIDLVFIVPPLADIEDGLSGIQLSERCPAESLEGVADEVGELWRDERLGRLITELVVAVTGLVDEVEPEPDVVVANPASDSFRVLRLLGDRDISLH